MNRYKDTLDAVTAILMFAIVIAGIVALVYLGYPWLAALMLIVVRLHWSNQEDAGKDEKK